MTKKLPSLVQPTDYYLLLVFQIVSNDVPTRRPWTITKNAKALEQVVKGSGAQVVFSSVLPVSRNDGARKRKIMKMNTWLQDWYYQMNFVDFGHESVDMTLGILGTGWVHLSQKEKIILDLKLPEQEEEVDEAFYKQLEVASQFQALVLVGDLNYPNVFCRNNTEKDKQSRRFLESIDDNFLSQVVEDPTRNGVLLDL
ncbi:hypothetical protein TURU_000453 [Turdus rufiventris]|nr:hypothetical protein TURU_000453 [Turdus rufiventris]